MSEETGPQATSNRIARQFGWWWWIRQWLLTGIAGFFVFFGISLLMASYRLGDPFSFIMTFFAASLIILISSVMVVGLVYRMGRVKSIDPCRNDQAVDKNGK